MNSQYKVPIIPQNLSKNETIIQIAEVLDHLSNVTDDIFHRVNKRLENNSRKLNNISERLELVHSKVDSLKGAKKATQVFSSSKYPASDCHKDYESIFNDVTHTEVKRHKVKPKHLTTGYEPLDKLQFYHVKVSNTNNNTAKLEGLGDIPLNIDCVNDLLLYNTGKNLYKDFVITDSLSGPKHFKEGDKIDSTDIGAAPASITERSSLNRKVTQNYFYAPKIGEVPALDVPIDLPDLPGIADDLRYENDIGPVIAPSALKENATENIPDLPFVPDTETEPKTVDVPDIVIPPPVPRTVVPEPPPIDKLPVIQNPVRLESDLQKIETKEADVVENTKSDSEKQVPSTLSTLPPVTDVRASLMEAIRNAGGAKTLKSAQRDESTASTKMPTNDLMADLHNKLLLRRKGISGNKKSENSGNNLDSTMSKLSALIPPPNSKTDVDSTSTDEEWD